MSMQAVGTSLNEDEQLAAMIGRLPSSEKAVVKAFLHSFTRLSDAKSELERKEREKDQASERHRDALKEHAKATEAMLKLVQESVP